MTWIAPISQTTTVTAPSSGDGIFIASNVTVSVAVGFGMVMQGSSHTAIIHGTVMSSDSVAAFIGNQTNQNGHDVTVAEGGELRSFADDGLRVRGLGSQIVNHGTISGNHVMQIETDVSNGETVIENHGLLEGKFAGISAIGEEAIRFENHGILRVLFGSSGVTFDSGNDTIVNSGLIANLVSLFGGDDLYDGRKGRSLAQVSGDDGEDTLFGGRFRDTLQGGNDTDRLRGGGASDVFVFHDNGSSDRDIILDFTAVGRKHDLLDISKVEAIENFADLTKNHIEVHGRNIWIESGDGDVAILRNVKLSQLDAGDFLFAN